MIQSLKLNDALSLISGCTATLMETVVDGEIRILVEPGDIEAHAGAFLHLANNPILRMHIGKSGWERAKAFFSSEKEKAELLNILNLPSSAAKTANVRNL
jgi:glycosyltransferase involved in cell wall biosynthesis